MGGSGTPPSTTGVATGGWTTADLTATTGTTTLSPTGTLDALLATTPPLSSSLTMESTTVGVDLTPPPSSDLAEATVTAALPRHRLVAMVALLLRLVPRHRLVAMV